VVIAETRSGLVLVVGQVDYRDTQSGKTLARLKNVRAIPYEKFDTIYAIQQDC